MRVSKRSYLVGLLAMSTSLMPLSLMAADEGLFTPFPTAKLKDELTRHYAEYPFIISAGEQRSDYRFKPIFGQVHQQKYKLAPEYSPAHILDNYREQIKKLGGEVLFECLLEACGDSRLLREKIALLDGVIGVESGYLFARAKNEQKEFYTAIQAAVMDDSASLHITTLEVIPEPLDLVTVNAAFLQQAPKQIEFKDNQKKDTNGAEDHPLISRLKGSYIQDFKRQGFASTVFVSSMDASNKPVLVEHAGKLTQNGYSIPKEYSGYEVFTNYKVALTKLGFETQFECQGKACGREDRFIKAIDSLANIGNEDSQFYAWYTLTRPEGNVHVSTYTIGYIGGLWTDLRVIEETELKDDRVGINLEALTDQIEAKGHVALEGLLFEFDSDKLLPEAQPVVEVLASYLKANPKRAFYVVGHTDDKGNQAYNQGLSQRRAVAIVKLLTTSHGIQTQQLEAVGIGEHAPVASNSDEAGQQQNRRVELVLRSDTK
ncbi:OmpA family protein [Shewanella sp. GD03713]|uniref:OmpA family protein n=1 Tax=Shewanella sp. GD03713 TaxID=2975372 RepID=UPI002448C9BB|nr:OmpA family protein [Shewanella sp. GD03713]MDH1468517.1 DUF4892 domain-containing protein [Shewanella sp. GD03713]